jgi:hypothetical protein
MAAHLTRSYCDGYLRSAAYPVQRMAQMICCGMTGVSVREMRALTVKVETVTLIGKGGYHPTCFVC